MIAETAALKALLSETADHQILAEMLGFVAGRPPLGDALHRLPGSGWRLMLTNCVVPARMERRAERVNQRNGYRERRWETRAGTVDVQIPKLRKGSYFPEFPGFPVFPEPSVPGPPSRLGEGNDGSDPGSLYPGRLNPLGR